MGISAHISVEMFSYLYLFGMVTLVKLEQRILHYAIVPQVAFFRNEQTVSFVSPYFRGGNLEQAIQNETDKTPGKTPHKPTAKPQTLSLPEKLRILQQICCAIKYLHQPPKCDRKAVTHGNINMKNVILDEQKNARLLVLKPRSVEGVGEEQFTGDKNKDVHDFKEMICKVLIDDSKTKDSILKSVSKKAVTFEDISKNLEVNLRQTGITKWTTSQETSKKCEICCVNKPGDRWGAILIAGTDKKPDVRKRFEDDIAKLKDKLITEVTVMGVREKNVITVTKSSTQYDEQLKKAFNQIDTSDINTLVLCYSGHHGDARFELDSENGKYLEDADLIITGREIDRILAFRPVRSGWLNVLEKSLKSSKLQVLKTRLIKYILHAYSTIPLNPILQHKHSKLVDFYEPTKMTTTIEETEHKDSKTRKPYDVPKTVQMDLSKIEELFISNQSYGYKSPSNTNRVYISGEAGMGKTSFSQYLALAWCAVHGETEECVSMREKMKKFKHFNDIEYLKQTQLLFLLHLRKFENESDCKKMLRTYLQSDLGYSNEDINELLSDINSPKTVLLMDGLDEWKCKATKMPLYTSVSDAIIICTSRPWKIDSCVIARLQDYNKVVITGIGFDSVGNLVRNVTNCFRLERIAVRDNTSDFIQTLRDKELRTILNLNASASREVLMIPVLILLLLCLWHDGKDFGSTRTQVYINMAEALLRRMKKKQGLQYKETTSDYQLPVLFRTMEAKCCIEQSENIAKLSEIAFCLLFTGQTEHSLQFSNKDLSRLGLSVRENLEIEKMFKDIKQFCLNSGNIRGTTRMSSSSQDKIYSFIHKSYQEFFAALHIVAQNCDQHICQEIEANTTSLQDVVDLTNVFDFVCEFDSNCIESMVSLIDELTTKHAMQTDDYRRINFIKTMQGIIFESCFKNIKEGKVSINLSNLVLNGSDRKTVLRNGELMNLLRTNENKIERHHLEITLNKTFGILCLTNLSLSSDMDVSQFDMEELRLVKVRTEFVNLSKVQRLKRIEICLNEPTTVSIQFQDAKKLNYLKLKNCSLSGPLDLSQCPLKELKLNMTKVETETLVITSCVQKCEALNMCCPFDFTNAIKLTNLNVMSCSLPGPLDLSQCPLHELKLYEVQTEKVVTGCVETCTVRHMNCSFEFMNAIELTNLSMMDCSIQGSLDLSKRQLVELNLQRVKTKKMVTGCVETCKVVDMNCSFVFTKANKLSMKDCSLPDSLDLSECSLEELTLYNVETQNVVTGCVKTCTVMRMNCLFEFTNPKTLTNLSMQSCSIPGQLDLSQCPLEELTLQTCSLSGQLDLFKCPIKKLTIQKCFLAGILDLSHYQLETLILDAINIKEVVTCSMETCTVGNMDCLFEFSNAVNLTNLSIISCSLPGPLDLSHCPLKKFNMEKCSLSGQLDLSHCSLELLILNRVTAEKVTIGCVNTCFLKSMSCSWQLVHCGVQNCIHDQPLTIFELKEACDLTSTIELSKSSIEHLILNEPNISPPVFEDQMRHIYSLSRHMTCTVRGLKKFWEKMDVGKKLMEAIEKMKTDGRFSVKQNSRTVTIRTRH
ncbi:uncharacterized protein LOC128221536 [Mya arenaria]|uniref:uncharacterized protein LOC128221536 n=1 Tax=Mya arenaria TaxID=6604 RepID=UPI0022E3B8B6|nr:uncharacterized protein LOC128221536 [Mya arenaria]